MSVPVLCAVPGRAEPGVVQALAGASRWQVARRCADLGELLSAAAAGLGRVAVVGSDLTGLDREAVQHLHGSGVWVVVLAAETAPWGPEPAGLGADALLGEASGQDLPDLLARLLDEAERTGTEPGRTAAPARSLLLDGPADAAPTADDGRPGRLVAVWGPTGAPGRTTLAVGLAAELAAAGGALLVDADTYGGTVAPALGLLDESPGLAAAVRAAGNGRLDLPTLAAVSPFVHDDLRVLTGLTRADRWPELPAAGLEVVWELSRRLAPWTVVDCGFCLEEDEVLSYDTRAPQRNAATLSALGAADQVVVVGAGDPIGLQRLVRALGELAAVVPGTPRSVVVNRVRASAAGPRPGDAVREALRRYAAVDEVHLVPEDQAGCDGALLAGRSLAEHAPGSPARRAIAALADALVTGLADALVPTPTGAAVAGRTAGAAH